MFTIVGILKLLGYMVIIMGLNVMLPKGSTYRNAMQAQRDTLAVEMTRQVEIEMDTCVLELNN